MSIYHKGVQIVRMKNGMTLVEWKDENNHPRRSWITPDMIIEETGPKMAIVDRPEAGVPYGMDFARVVNPSVTPEEIDRCLKRVGIWTIDDLRNNPQAVMGALKQAYGLDFAQLMLAAKEYEQDLLEV